MSAGTDNRRAPFLSGVRHIVVKVGSQVLTRGEGGLDDAVLDALGTQICGLAERGLEVALVTSGAIAAGRMRLGFKERPRTIPLKQASAAAGQALLMARYAESFARHERAVAQILLTADDLRNRRRFLNARNTLLTLFELGVVPIINENDTVAVHEIKFGDNDRLSSLVVNLLEADLLVLLTDIDGFYARDPRADPEAARYDFIEELTDEHLGQAGASRSGVGLGGMITKLEAARQAALSGASTVIARGTDPDVLSRILAGEPVGTFIAERPRIGMRKHWIAYTVQPTGELLVDAGAAAALADQKRSLLPAGVREVRGEFGPGEAVRVVGPDGAELARGLVAYGADALRRIAGRRTGEIESILGYKVHDEVIHRDNLAVTWNHRRSGRQEEVQGP
jgi:glutamate 5-kinase